VSYKRGLAIVFGCAIAGLVAFAATYPRFLSQVRFGSANCCLLPPAATRRARRPVPTAFRRLSEPTPASPMAWSQASPTARARVALAPFAGEWDSVQRGAQAQLDQDSCRDTRRLSPDAQKRLHERMTEWIRMTPDQRQSRARKLSGFEGIAARNPPECVEGVSAIARGTEGAARRERAQEAAERRERAAIRQD
jgi:hypothetical protein